MVQRAADSTSQGDAVGRPGDGGTPASDGSLSAPADTAAGILEGRLRCPISGSRLRRLTDKQCAALNERIGAGKLYDRMGRLVQEPLDAALGDEQGRWAYRIERGIPQLLSGEALVLSEKT